MSRPHITERGMTLIITLIMLIVITLFVVSMVRLNSTNTAIISNMRAQKSVESEAQQQVEIAVNQYQFFSDVINGAGKWSDPNATFMTDAELWAAYKPTGATSGGAPAKQSNDVKIYRPQCTYSQTATGYSALSGVAPQDTYWDMKVTASDSATGATAEVHQGIQIRLPPGNCL